MRMSLLAFNFLSALSIGEAEVTPHPPRGDVHALGWEASGVLCDRTQAQRREGFCNTDMEIF